MFLKLNEWKVLSSSLNESLLYQDKLLCSLLSSTKTPKWIETTKSTNQLEAELSLGFYMVPNDEVTW